MKSQRNYRSPIVSHYSFFALLTALLLTILLIISCTNEKSIIEPEAEEIFDSRLIMYYNFIHSSVPAHDLNCDPQIANNNRAHIYWYNHLPSDIKVKDILGDDMIVRPEKELVNVLDIVFEPSENGIYNTSNLDSKQQNNWGGLFMSLLKTVYEEIYNKNAILKIWMRIESAPDNAVFNIDLGKISEDIIPNSRLDTEDKNANGILDDGEDTGLDGLFDPAEPGYQNGKDPHYDNFSHDLTPNFKWVNGLEGNRYNIVNLHKPDTEDINGNYALDLNNDYYSYKIPLDINKIEQTKIVERGLHGWFLIKIPVELPDARIGNPDRTILETLRLWISNSESQVHIRIAEIKFDVL